MTAMASVNIKLSMNLPKFTITRTSTVEENISMTMTVIRIISSKHQKNVLPLPHA